MLSYEVLIYQQPSHGGHPSIAQLLCKSPGQEGHERGLVSAEKHFLTILGEAEQVGRLVFQVMLLFREPKELFDLVLGRCRRDGDARGRCLGHLVVDERN
ncbi:hypothetical protein Ae201684P_003163 [Aphanomyces euteiches]|uniref:Uncharacterized protein n=1 Tax=Aphanomyces euteiches TaxID=100861 RepID=A0A6G0X341_9STRA|nr:hypothetical protein Ae201684_009074 [Aphanomyces euteiches]KAH9073660.1 hypothetical protein Ae201684P_003163 [Aphanomyces euteiches]